jgi:hypothetical protein
VAQCLGWDREGRRRARVGCPWWLGSAGEERWCWSVGAVEGTGKEVQGAPGVGTELRALTVSSAGDWGGISQWLNDGGTTAQWRE